jgi:hypothetical protein
MTATVQWCDATAWELLESRGYWEPWNGCITCVAMHFIAEDERAAIDELCFEWDHVFHREPGNGRPTIKRPRRCNCKQCRAMREDPKGWKRKHRRKALSTKQQQG